jgi:hypothetical protein
MPRRRNAGDELPYDEWIPAHAVKFNSDGTVEIMTESERETNASVQYGHWAGGTFHPWRASKDYKTSTAGEGRKPKYRTSRSHAKASDYVPFSEWGG